MSSRIIRHMACSMTGAAALFLALGVVLFQAASATGAASDYSVHITWSSALRSAIWPPSWRLVLLLLGVFLLTILTLLIFFRAPRGFGVATLLLGAGIAFYFGGALGWFFIFRELETDHFGMDAEKLGEYWFVFEAVAVWTLVVTTLAAIRFLAGPRAERPHG